MLANTYDGDRLMNFDHKVCAYDALGNPTMYKNKAANWDFRSLTAYDGMTFAYDAFGVRISKSGKGVNSKFCYNNGQLIAEKRTVTSNHVELPDEYPDDYQINDVLDITYIHGVNGITGFRLQKNSGEVKTYYYRKNIMGDVTHIFDAEGVLKAKYIYDAWGNHEIVHNEDNIAKINAIRYRGYFYDVETGFYYLKSRYYDAQTGRFISADMIEIIDETKTHINGLNLYAYCENNPIMRRDDTGMFWWWIAAGIGAVVGAVIGGVAAAVNGANVWEGIGLGALSGATTGLGIAVANAGLVTVGVSSLLGGITNAVAGESFAAGWAGGLIAGAILVAGGGLAQILAATSIKAAMWTGFGFGIAGSVVNDMVLKKNISIGDALVSGVISATTWPIDILIPGATTRIIKGAVYGLAEIISEWVSIHLKNFWNMIFHNA